MRLLAEGLTNAEIAARLVLSVRTVDTHVAAILEKLRVPTRRDAVAQANDLGLLADLGLRPRAPTVRGTDAERRRSSSRVAGGSLTLRFSQIPA